MYYRRDIDGELENHISKITTVENSLQHLSTDMQLITKDMQHIQENVQELVASTKDIHGLVFQINNRLIQLEAVQARIPWMPKIIEKNIKLIISILFGLILLLVQSLIYLK